MAQDEEAPPTEEPETLDDIHAQAAVARQEMGPLAADGNVVSSGTEFPVEPGPGPEVDAALDAATGGAMSAAVESAEAGPQPSPMLASGGVYDPGAHTVQEVLDYIEEHPDEADDIYAAEEAGKGRSGILG